MDIDNNNGYLHLSVQENVPQEILDQVAGILEQLSNRLSQPHIPEDFMYCRLENVLEVLARFSVYFTLTDGNQILQKLEGALQLLEVDRDQPFNGFKADEVKRDVHSLTSPRNSWNIY